MKDVGNEDLIFFFNFQYHKELFFMDLAEHYCQPEESHWKRIPLTNFREV